MTDFAQFGKQLQLLRKRAGLSRKQLARRLDQLASAGPREEYRVVDGTLISRWERADVRAGRRWRPTRAYEYYVAAYARREEVYDPRHAAHTSDGFARLLIRLGRYAQARQLSQQALAEQRQLGDRMG